MHLPNVTDEDNSQYTCVAVNNGGRVECSAELYVLEKGIIYWYKSKPKIYFMTQKKSKKKVSKMSKNARNWFFW